MQNHHDAGPGTEKWRLLLRVTVTLLVLSFFVIIFYPKERVVGGLRGGPIAPGELAYREDYNCIGFIYDFCPNWPDYGCDYLCFGIVTHRTCSMESYETIEGFGKEPAACQGAAQYRWGFPGR